MLEGVNLALAERPIEAQYVSMIYAIWNDNDRMLQVANSGAVQPIFCRAGESNPIRAEGFPLGMFPDVTYDELSIATQPGDVVLFVSDGILDAENERGEMYGEGRLAALIGTGILNTELKAVVQRLRPQLPEPWLTEPGWSFPSGHAMGSLVAYGFLAYLLTRMTPANFPRRTAVTVVA